MKFLTPRPTFRLSLWTGLIHIRSAMVLITNRSIWSHPTPHFNFTVVALLKFDIQKLSFNTLYIFFVRYDLKLILNIQISLSRHVQQSYFIIWPINFDTHHTPVSYSLKLKFYMPSLPHHQDKPHTPVSPFFTCACVYMWESKPYITPLF